MFVYSREGIIILKLTLVMAGLALARSLDAGPAVVSLALHGRYIRLDERGDCSANSTGYTELNVRAVGVPPLQCMEED